MNFTIVVVGITGQQFPIQVCSETSVGDLKEKVKTLLGLNQGGKEKIILLFAEKSLDEDCKSLCSLGVSVDSQISLVVSSEGGVSDDEIIEDQDVSRFLLFFTFLFSLKSVLRVILCKFVKVKAIGFLTCSSAATQCVTNA